jgi:hypothetical protein
MLVHVPRRVKDDVAGSTGNLFAARDFEVTMLHKAGYLKGFHIQATDGDAGHVDEFLFDQTWTIRYLVVDVSNWIGGRSVLIPSTAIDKVDSPEKKIHVKLTRDEVTNSASVETADIELIETLPPVIM